LTGRLALGPGVERLCPVLSLLSGVVADGPVEADVDDPAGVAVG
jgi:hypothetical protein